MRYRALRLLVLLLTIVLGSAVDTLQAQPALAGPEIVISSASSSSIEMAPAAGGGFIVAWRQKLEVLARGFDAQGASVFPAIQVGQADGGIDVAAVGSGFVVVGLSDSERHPLRLARIFDAAGRPEGNPVVVETRASSPLDAKPRVAAARDGSFVVTWIGRTASTSGEEVFLRRFSAAGVPQGEPWRVLRENGSAGVCCADIAQGPGGKILVVWVEKDPWLIWGQLFSSAGVAAAPPFRISTGTYLNSPVAASVRDGFLVAWSGREAPELREGIHAQLYDRGGHLSGARFSVTPEDDESLFAPIIANDAQGRGFVIWSGSRSGFHLQQIGADRPEGPRLANLPGLPKAAVAAAGWGEGNLALAWNGYPGLVAQRFASGDSSGVLQLVLGRIATPEEGGAVAVQVERREGNLGAVTASYALRAKSARAGKDFLAAEGTVTFADGESGPKDLFVSVLDDPFAEPDESFVLELSQPTGGALLGLSRTRIEIRDDDVPSPLLANAGPVVEVVFTDWQDNLHPQVAVLAGGGFLIAWLIPDRHGPTFLARQLYDPEGRKITKAFPVSGGAESFFLAAQPGGGFTVVALGDGDWGRRFDPWGRPRTETFTVPGFPMTIAIAAGSTGGFRALSPAGATFGSQDVLLTSYGAYGHPLGPPLRINRSPACTATPPALASDRLGRTVVLWRGSIPKCDRILLRLTDAAGRPEGRVLEAAALVGRQIGRIAVAAAPDRRFVVVWEAESDGDGLGIFARTFSADGQSSSEVIQVNSRWQGSQRGPGVAVQADGRFLVIWQSPGESTYPEARGQYFAADGRRLGSDFLIDPEILPVNDLSVATDAAGHYVVGWGRSIEAIHYRRFTAPPIR